LWPISRILHGLTEFFYDMRRTTARVGIVAVPTAVTGFFGQDVLYPGCGENSGFIASVAIMLIVAGALFLVFKRRNWL
jgi:magnesium transporter